MGDSGITPRTRPVQGVETVDMVILPSAYMGSVSYFAHLLREDCVIDTGEHFIKRSQRNRAVILSANGPLPLTVNVEHANTPRRPMRDVRIDYSKRWQHQHWVSIVSAYRSAPYFDYYAQRIEPFYRRQWRYLLDYNMEYTEALLQMLGVSRPLRVSDVYVEAAAGDIDLRPRHNEGPAVAAEPYIQVFADRMPFVADLSVLDLILCEGPAAIDVVSGH